MGVRSRAILLGAALVAVGLALAAGGCGPQVSSDPAELVATGWDRYILSEHSQAIRCFEQAVSLTPKDSPLHLQALYGLATTWNLRRPSEDRDLAEKLYRQIIDLSPQGDMAAWSWLAIARMHAILPVGQDPKLADVIRGYQEVLDRFPNHPAGHEALLHQQAAIAASQKPEDARQVIATLEAFLAKHPDSKYASPYFSLISCCYLVLGEPEKRLAAELKAYEKREVDPTNPNMDNVGVYWGLATIAEYEVGDFATARKFYKMIMEEYPADVRVFACRKSLKRMDEMEAKAPAAPKTAAGGGGGA